MYIPIAEYPSRITVLPVPTKFITTYSAIDTMAMTIVETVGLRYLGCIFANHDGMALYAAMDRVVRAVGRMVVWVDAAADDSTIRIRSRLRTVPKPLVPKMALPWTESTSKTLFGFCRPTPVVPTPANDSMAKMTSA